MTTATPTTRRGSPVLGPLSVTAVTGLVTVAAGAVVGGPPAALGALIGTAIVTLVFASGAVVIGTVALVAPSASLLVALLTYTLQVLAVGLVYVGLSGGGALDGPVDAPWLSGAVIAGTVAWTLSHLVAVARSRQPVYDLGSRGPEAGAR